MGTEERILSKMRKNGQMMDKTMTTNSERERDGLVLVDATLALAIEGVREPRRQEIFEIDLNLLAQLRLVKLETLAKLKIPLTMKEKDTSRSSNRMKISRSTCTMMKMTTTFRLEEANLEGT